MHPHRKSPLTAEEGSAQRPKIASRQRRQKIEESCCGHKGELIGGGDGGII